MENALVQRVKSQMKNLQVLSEELKVQMALGKAEARDLVEEERKTLSKYINSQRQQMANDDASETENRRTFLTAIENLESALNVEIPSKVEAYDKYKNGILERVYQVEEIVKTNYSSMSLEMQEVLATFKTKMDAFRVNLALHDKDNPEKVARIKAEFTDKLQEVRALLGQNEVGQTKLDQFVEDISESFSYLKRAINDLSK